MANEEELQQKYTEPEIPEKVEDILYTIED